MDRRIANMDDGSMSARWRPTMRWKNAASAIWLPGHGQPGAGVLQWNRELFEGIYRPCEQAIKDGLPLEETKALVLKDARVASRAKGHQGLRAEYR